MSQPYVGEIRLVGFNFAPNGWNFCNGALLPISEFETLFNLIGTTYGGDGQQTFAVPDLQGRAPLHQGNNGVSTYVIGEVAGVESVTINSSQYPQHTHSVLGSTNAGSVATPANNVIGSGQKIFTSVVPTNVMNSNMLSSYGGGSQPHENLQPYLVLNWIIAQFGVYPSPT
jgi:microcystin-dependent protein